MRFPLGGRSSSVQKAKDTGVLLCHRPPRLSPFPAPAPFAVAFAEQVSLAVSLQSCLAKSTTHPLVVTDLATAIQVLKPTVLVKKFYQVAKLKTLVKTPVLLVSH